MSNSHFYLSETDIPLYRGKLVVIITNDVDMLKERASFSKDSIFAHSILCNWGGFQGFVIILNFKNAFRKIDYGAIAHEVNHTVDFIAQERGFQPDFNNDEPICYLSEFVTNEVYKLINQHNFKPVINDK